MHAEQVIRALLLQAGAVTALVSDRCYPGQLPQGCPLPALVIEHISTVDLPTLDAAAAYGLTRSRIQVTVLASTYPAQKALAAAAVAACKYQRGLIAGIRVITVTRELLGPDQRDDDRSVFHQSIDFLITFQE